MINTVWLDIVIHEVKPSKHTGFRRFVKYKKYRWSALSRLKNEMSDRVMDKMLKRFG